MLYWERFIEMRGRPNASSEENLNYLCVTGIKSRVLVIRSFLLSISSPFSRSDGSEKKLHSLCVTIFLTTVTSWKQGRFVSFLNHSLSYFSLTTSSLLSSPSFLSISLSLSFLFPSCPPLPLPLPSLPSLSLSLPPPPPVKRASLSTVYYSSRHPLHRVRCHNNDFEKSKVNLIVFGTSHFVIS